MSEVIMGVLQRQVASLTRQVEKLAPENERLRKLLTEFDIRHDQDQVRISDLKDALWAIELHGSSEETYDPVVEKICRDALGGEE